MNTLGEIWIQLFKNGSFGFILLLVINQMVYFVLLMSKTNRSDKYKFAAHNEVKYLKRTANLFSIAIFFYLFGLISGWLGLAQSYEFIFVAFMAFMITFMIGYGFTMYLQYYYPFVLEKRLRAIRFKKLKSSSGNYMKLLNELEEDEFMSDEMIALEDASEADFINWITSIFSFKIGIQKTFHAFCFPSLTLFFMLRSRAIISSSFEISLDIIHSLNLELQSLDCSHFNRSVDLYLS